VDRGRLSHPQVERAILPEPEDVLKAITDIASY
jgi:hypothetical protein